MGQLPQLFMRHPDLSQLPPLAVPSEFSLRTCTEGDESAWEELISKSFNTFFSFDGLIRKWKGFAPENVMFLEKNGRLIATASGLEKAEFPNEGYLHMVGTLPEESGNGAGKAVVLAALHSLRERGFKTAVLSTDDFRLPAIKLYYRLGFRPLYSHESHKERWDKILPLCK